jgi:HPt (histidine-containing phosphotransfer) domain-containing protein
MIYALLDDAHWCRLDRDLGAAQTEELRVLAARSLRALLEGLEFATAHGARGDVRRGAERLAGTAAMAGLPALTQAARALERAAKGPGWEGTDAVMKPVRALGQRSLDALSLAQPSPAQPPSTPTSL